MNLINDARKRSLFVNMMEEFGRRPDLKVDLDNFGEQDCYGYNLVTEKLWVALELPPHFDEGFLNMVVYRDEDEEIDNDIVCHYIFTYGDEEYIEHEFDDYYAMMMAHKMPCGCYNFDDCACDNADAFENEQE